MTGKPVGGRHVGSVAVVSGPRPVQLTPVFRRRRLHIRTQLIHYVSKMVPFLIAHSFDTR